MGLLKQFVRGCRVQFVLILHGNKGRAPIEKLNWFKIKDLSAIIKWARSVTDIEIRQIERSNSQRLISLLSTKLQLRQAWGTLERYCSLEITCAGGFELWVHTTNQCSIKIASFIWPLACNWRNRNLSLKGRKMFASAERWYFPQLK